MSLPKIITSPNYCKQPEGLQCKQSWYKNNPALFLGLASRRHSGICGRSTSTQQKDEKGIHSLTRAGLACTSFSKGACSRSHIVIATAKLGAPTLSRLILLGLGPVGFRGLEKKVGKLGMGLGPAEYPGQPGEGQQEGPHESKVHDPSWRGPEPG